MLTALVDIETGREIPGSRKAGRGQETLTTDTDAPSRETQIVYLTEWAARYRCSLQLNGEVGFGRDCTGILKDSHYIDTADIKGETAYNFSSGRARGGSRKTPTTSMTASPSSATETNPSPSCTSG